MPSLPALDAIDLQKLRRMLGPEQAPALLLSAATGPQGHLDLLPLVREAPLCVPYPGAAGHSERLAEFAVRLDQMPVGSADSGPDFSRGGWLIYLAYEFASVFESHVRSREPELDEPLALLWPVSAAVIRDRQTGQTTLTGRDLEFWRDRLQLALAAAAAMPAGADNQVLELQEDDPQAFLDGVARIHEYLEAGDVFQVNISRAWRAQAPRAIDLNALFAQLCAANPAPFAGIVQHGDWGLASSSPERLVSVHGDLVQTRPIAGTRRRDPDAARDAELLAELTRDPKERAEHIMLIDLERNDLGRICKPGTVEVDELGVVESYTHVHHLVSNVRGRLQPGTSAWDLLRATFPGGTITGCPKVRCMQIIAELEPLGRGAYTGALGYVGADGSADFNILIRTIACVGRQLVFRAGAGIVADSIASRELGETRSKAKGLLRALGVDR
ncbi:MAG: aminodeoxychorismate synthase component I [Lysobacterales bacterium]